MAQVSVFEPVIKFSTLLAPPKRTSPLFAVRIIPSKSAVVAVVALVKLGVTLPLDGTIDDVRGRYRLSATFSVCVLLRFRKMRSKARMIMPYQSTRLEH